MIQYLKVKINDNWKYVFCKNNLFKEPITTDDKTKAIKGTENSLLYFEKHYPEYTFKISNKEI